MFWVSTKELKTSLEGNTISKSTLYTLRHRVARRVYEIVQELQYKLVAGVGDRKILLEGAI